jgi:hypothetical protein
MDAEMYCQILNEYLVPFIQTVYPNNHCFMQDDDPKHTSRRAQKLFMDKSINRWHTPPESPEAQLKTCGTIFLNLCMYTYTEKEQLLFSDSESDDIELGKMYKLSCTTSYCISFTDLSIKSA